MDTVDTYMNVLLDTLQRKKSVLEQILEATEQQKHLLMNEGFDEDAFQVTLNQKEKRLHELEKLDNGFEQIYERVALAMKHNKDLYKDAIVHAQKLISDIMDLSVNIQALEEQNKNRFPACMMKKREKIGNFKVSNRVAANYYKNMPNVHQDGQSYFLNKKN